MRWNLKKILVASSLVSLPSCDDGVGNVHFDISAKTPDGMPVSDAVVTLDHSILGQTNAYGTFIFDTKISPNKYHKITVSKGDSQYYYAPSFESFKLSAGESKTISLAPKMYIVPKPQRAKIAKINNKSQTSNSKITPTVGDESQSNELPFMEIAETFTLAAQELIAQTPNAHSMFTVHVYTGRSILRDAQVTWIDSKNLESHCVTNDRGRCIINSQSSFDREGSLLVQHDGFKSTLKMLLPTSNSNARVTLESGASIDIKTVSVTPWSQTPAGSVSIRSQGVLLATSNPQGLAVAALTGPLPVTLDLESARHHTTLHTTISKQQDYRLSARFPDEAKQRLETQLVYPLHVDGAQRGYDDLVDLKASEPALAEASHAQPTNLSPKNWSTLPKETLSFLPVLKIHGTKFELQISAITSQGIIATSDPIPLNNTKLSASWKKSSELAMTSLRKNIPWPGIVTSNKLGKLEVSINTSFLKIGDQLSIDSIDEPLLAKITSVEKDKVIAEGINTNPENDWKLIGAVSRKLLNQSIHLAKFKSEFETLAVVYSSNPNLRLAKKYFAENSHREALIDLSKVAPRDDADIDTIEIIQLRAAITHAMGNSTDTLLDLQKILEFSAAHGQKMRVLATEANILRTQIEALIALPGDKSVAERFEEMAERARNIKSELSALGQLSSKNATILEYTNLLAQRKKAESDDDPIALATQSGVWTGFDAALNQQDWSPKEMSLWKRIANGELAKVAIIKETSSSDDLKKSM